MFDEFADYDFNELTIMLSEAFYSGMNDVDYMSQSNKLMQELQWRLENTRI